MSAALTLLIRFIHLLGMAILLGGAVCIWNSLRTTGDQHSLITRYEWLFWGTVGVMFVTGVGNIGALGAPAPTTRWGTLLTVKLAVVTLFVGGSFLRTLFILQRTNRGRATAGTDRSLQYGYALTVGLLVLIVAVAEVLAHG